MNSDLSFDWEGEDKEWDARIGCAYDSCVVGLSACPDCPSCSMGRVGCQRTPTCSVGCIFLLRGTDYVVLLSCVKCRGLVLPGSDGRIGRRYVRHKTVNPTYDRP